MNNFAIEFEKRPLEILGSGSSPELELSFLYFLIEV